MAIISNLFRSQKPSNTPPPEKIGQISPTGSSLFGTIDPETGEFVSTEGQTIQKTFETDFQEQFRTGQEQLQLGVLGQLGQPLTDVRTAGQIEQGLSGVPTAERIGTGGRVGVGAGVAGLRRSTIETGGLPQLGQDFSSDISRLEEASFQGVAQRLAPGFEDQRRRLAQQLADQGIPIGSEAFERELTRQETAQGEILSRAGFDAVAAGRQEQGRLAALEQSQRGQLFGEEATTTSQEFQQQQAIRQLNLANQQQQFQQRSAAKGQAFQQGLASSGQFFNQQLAGQQQQQQLALSLASLEQQQRAQQFGELGALGGFVSPFTPTPVQAVGAGSRGARSAGEGFAILGAIAGGQAGGGGS